MIRVELPFSRVRRDDIVWVTHGTDFAALARELCAAEQEVWPCTDPRWDPDPEPLLKAYLKLRESPFGALLSDAVAACLSDPDPGVRYVGLCFFTRFPEQPGAQRALDLLGDPGFEGDDGSILDFLTVMVARGDPRALSMARAEVLGETNREARDRLARALEDLNRPDRTA
ncbi:MAG: hypothetical protein AB1758_20245 [Candidatus Eremiobacterota bacterium]